MRWLPCLVAASATGCLAGSTNRLVDETFALPALVRPASAAREAPATDDADLAGPVTRSQLVALAVARDPGLRAIVHGARAGGSRPGR